MHVSIILDLCIWVLKNKAQVFQSVYLKNNINSIIEKYNTRIASKMRLNTYFVFYIFICICTFSCNRIKREIHLLPEGFMGSAFVIYGETTGVEDSIVGESVIYKIPKTGVLVVKNEPYYVNTLYSKCFYYSKNDSLTAICNYHNSEPEGRCISEVNNYSSGVFNGLEYRQVIVGSPQSKSSISSEIELFMDSSKVIQHLLYLKKQREEK